MSRNRLKDHFAPGMRVHWLKSPSGWSKVSAHRKTSSGTSAMMSYISSNPDRLLLHSPATRLQGRHRLSPLPPFSAECLPAPAQDRAPFTWCSTLNKRFNSSPDRCS